jgi:hypothetical protein
MHSRVTEARLRRLATELKPVETTEEAAARQALHRKLDAMAARLQVGAPTAWGEVHRHVQEEEHAIDEHSGRLEALLDDPDATDCDIDMAIADLRIARLKADVALKIASFADAPTRQATDRPQPV